MLFRSAGSRNDKAAGTHTETIYSSAFCLCYKAVFSSGQVFAPSILIMVLYLIDQHCRMLQTDTDCNAFRFNRHMIRSQLTIYISRRMSGCQYHGSEKSLSCICFDTFDFIVLNNQCIHSCLEMYFSEIGRASCRERV